VCCLVEIRSSWYIGEGESKVHNAFKNNRENKKRRRFEVNIRCATRKVIRRLFKYNCIADISDT